MIYFITGGSRGIGANLVAEAVKAGHDVAFTYNSNEAMAREVVDSSAALREGAIVRCYRLDVCDSAQVESVVDAVVEDFDTIDVVVNNAGITKDNVLVSMEDDEWADVIATNLTGPFYVCRQVLPIMLSARFGRIINISSLVASGGSGQANYAASKAGLHGLTRTISKEYGRRGITANVVCPGYFETDMTKDALPEPVRKFWNTYAKVPKGRTGKLEEIATVVNFLASEGASFVNGQVINVTAGLDWAP
ncbi:MAG: SDR family oxidoreductase [Deltaproteobacteria bacterium]|nr:SDR family oxidoreductase [Deltaproteobacteria bacterium]